MKHKSYIHLILLQLIVLASCNQSQDGDYIKMDCTPTVETFISRIESISFCPLQTDDLHILGSNIDLLPVDDSFILVDRLNGSIFRYSADGSFLNQIGSKGRGPIEYVNIESVQWDSENECLIVFSKPDKVLFYSKDGSFIKSDAVPNKGLQSFYTENGVLTYYSYLPEMKYRAALLSEGDIKPYIPSEPIVIAHSAQMIPVVAA